MHADKYKKLKRRNTTRHQMIYTNHVVQGIVSHLNIAGRGLDANSMLGPLHDDTISPFLLLSCNLLLSYCLDKFVHASMVLLACLIACLWLPCCAYIDIIFLIDMNRGMS